MTAIFSNNACIVNESVQNKGMDIIHLISQIVWITIAGIATMCLLIVGLYFVWPSDDEQDVDGTIYKEDDEQ